MMRAALVMLGVASSLAAPPVGAQEQGPGEEACMAAYTDNQRLRKGGDLLGARDALRTCADRSCPDLVVKDCTTWLEQLETNLPSLVLAVKDEAGDDVVDARVTLDGAELASAFDGKPIEVNPGTHEIAVSRGEVNATKSVVVRSGEKGRVVTILLDSEITPPPVAEGAPTAVDDDGPPALLITGGVLAGLGVVGLGVFAGLGAVGAGEAGDLEDGCGEGAPQPNTNTCTQDEIDAVRTKLIAADVSLAIGATLAAVGLTLIIVDLVGDDGPGDVSSVDSVQLAFGAGPLAGGAYGQLELRY